ncbi:MAG TPA: hypothetical protein PLZ45_12355 [Ferruginibacter sp.]|nr:hypothetical protein [Ferruginibacter sp.]
MENTELVRLLNKELAMQLPDRLTYTEVHEQVSGWINDMIKTDFERLVSFLYRIDVSEQKLRFLLQQHPQEDAGHIIASLVLDRQEQKLKTRELFSQRDAGVDEEERW